MKRSYAYRLSLSVQLLGDILRYLPDRLWRFIRHWLVLPRYFRNNTLHGLDLPLSGRLLLWLGELPCLVLDIAGIAEGFEIANCWLKPNSRGLNAQEIRLAKVIFGPTIPYKRIQLDERARFGPKQYRFCYVSFCVINSWEAMPPAILIHELVHVWQFRRHGSTYILRALLAQRTAMGYDYGGLGALQRSVQNDRGLAPFNYEQQASIIEDYYRLQQIGRPRWNTVGEKAPLETYAYFVAQLHTEGGRH